MTLRWHALALVLCASLLAACWYGDPNWQIWVDDRSADVLVVTVGTDETGYIWTARVEPRTEGLFVSHPGNPLTELRVRRGSDCTLVAERITDPTRLLLVTVAAGGRGTIEPVDSLSERRGLEGFPEAAGEC